MSSLPASLGNPPPLLPKPVGSVPPLTEHPTTSTGTAKPTHGQPVSSPDSYPKTKPPPLLSLNILQGSPPPHHGPIGTQAPSTSRGHPPPPHGPSASETRSLLYGPPPLHGHPAPHSSSAFRNPHPLSSPTAPRALLASHATHPPRPHNGPHGFHIHGPPPSSHGPPLQNGPSGLRAPPPLLRNLRMRNPAEAPPQLRGGEEREMADGGT
ncbi:hypothetical protein QTP86_025365 [Hemibagrus guttatus]|nr:hypothetical protein QTP86_025365 [Hemibagrus guttatus]